MKPHLRDVSRLLASAEIEYVTDLKRTGLYGYSVDEVVRSLVQAGIRDAIERGFIKIRTFPDLDGDDKE